MAYDKIMDFSGLFGDHFVPEQTHSINLSFQVDHLSLEFGGTAGNVAYNLALLGEKSDIIATVGTDFGSYKAHLMQMGIDNFTIKVAENALTSTAYVFTDKADNQIAAFFAGAGNNIYSATVETEGRAFAIICPGCPSDMTALPSYYRQHNIKYLYDPGQQIPLLSQEELRDGINGAQVLFGSDYEFGMMMQKTGWSQDEIIKHVEVFVVTFGAQGTHVITKDGTIKVQSVPAQAIVDPTGAGDAHRAGFIKGMLAGLSYETCAKLASVAAVYVVESYGTQKHQFTLTEIQDRYHKTYGEKIAL